MRRIKRLRPTWVALNEDNNVKTGILFLPGRMGYGEDLTYRYASVDLPETVFIGITPEGFEWYPMPNGPNDQSNALAGIEDAYGAIDRTLNLIEKRYGIARSNMVLSGFSAGGVMTIQSIVRSEEPLAAGIVHAGAILDPDALPECECDTPLLVIHSQNDDCFEWEERYLPMKNALKDKGYNAFFIEKQSGGHIIQMQDIAIAGYFLNHILGYPPEKAERLTRYVPKSVLKWKIPTMVDCDHVLGTS